MTNYIFTSESVSEGNSGKITDQVSKAIPGTYSNQEKTALPRSPTPSWRKPDPSQWRYTPKVKGGH